MSKCISNRGEYSEHEYTTKPICDYCGQISEMIALAQLQVMRTALEQIQELHKPVHPTFSWNNGLRLWDPCPTCQGKAGVHECGCWADDDTVFFCAECSDFEIGKGRRTTWPCDTRKLADEGLTDRMARTSQGENNE